jgi:hypothetical protein
MALGGIPVAGGAANHGTLISTNLLYSPLLRDAHGIPLARPAYTLGGDAGVTGYEAAFAIDRDPTTILKTAASTNDLAVTMIHGATPPTVYGVVLIGHNITAAGVSLAKFEGGMDVNYNTVSEDLVINVATLTPIYHLLATPVAYSHWRIRINFVASTALQIGEIFLIGDPPLAFDRNYNKGFIPDLEIGETVSEGISGVPRRIARWERLRYEFEFTDISLTQLTALQLAARNGHVIFSPSGANDKAYFGMLELQRPKNISAKSVAAATYTITAVFTEAAQ